MSKVEKKTKKATVAAPVTASSIDDIFAGGGGGSSSKPKLASASKVGSTATLSKGKSKAASNDKSTTPSASTSSSTGIETNDKKPKKRKTSSSNVPIFDPSPSSAAPRAVVEVVDPSLPVVPESATTGKSAVSNGTGKIRKRDKKEVEEDELFRDSRGDGPRRKTEEGFLIYKEAELGIDPEAGGTPLCPFDCECCF